MTLNQLKYVIALSKETSINEAATVADCIGMTFPEAYAPLIHWLTDILKERLGETTVPL